MTYVAIGCIEPQAIVNAFGAYQIGITQAYKGDGHPDDGRFRDLETGWQREVATWQLESYLRLLVRETKRGSYNFIEFWGWPEVRYRDDGCGMVYSRVRMLHVIAAPPTQGRPN